MATLDLQQGPDAPGGGRARPALRPLLPSAARPLRSPGARRLRLRAGAVVLAVAAMGALAGAAPGAVALSRGVPGAVPATLPAIQAAAAGAITVRDSALTAAVAAVNANTSLSAADKTNILATLNGALTNVNAVGAAVQADTAVSNASADYTAIFLNFRVFALVIPQARLAAAAYDLTDTVLPSLQDAQNRLSGLLSGPEQSKNSAAVQTAMADLAKQLTAISSATNGMAAQVLSYKAGDWNGDNTILAAARAGLISARTSAAQAAADVNTVVGALQ
ncbi:MAG: hypothetical protein KGQ66_04690 [Acidobacteriota bacterium]|nr:hypothetical protein [Acidobacteriota bacterium]